MIQKKREKLGLELLPRYNGKESLISGIENSVLDDFISSRILRDIIKTIEEISPENIILKFRNELEVEKNQIFVCIGKNAQSYALAIQKNLKKRFIKKIWVFQPAGYSENKVSQDNWYLDLDHPIPSEKNISAVKSFLANLENNNNGSIYHFFISGGSSSVFVMPEADLPNELYLELNEVLFKSGLPIEDLNFCRQVIDSVKGGKLLSRLNAECVFNWIASDVITDDPRVIGSGITVGSIPSTDHNKSIAEKLFAPFLGPLIINKLLKLQSQSKGNGIISNQIIISRSILVNNLIANLFATGIECKLLNLSLEGDYMSLGDELSWFIDTDFSEGVFVCAGEWTVKLPDGVTGIGGRLSHLITYLSLLIQSKCTIIGLATDGNDGNSGDNFYLLQTPIGSQIKSKARNALNTYDTNSFIKEKGFTGHFTTNTNLMDILFFIKN